MNQITLASARQNLAESVPAIGMSLDTVAGFEYMQRAAKLFAASSIVPAQYRGDNGLPNCFIAIDMAIRMGANPLLVMQNLYVVHGNPAWSAQFLIATFNKCGRFSAIRYEFQGEQGKDDWGCRAVAIELATKEKLAGPLITIGMAKKEGWYGKGGSKWQSMPEQMLRYRAAAWFVRVYAPEIAMGLRTAEEEEDRIITVEATSADAHEMTMEDIAAPNAVPDQETPKKNGRRKEKQPDSNDDAGEITPPRMTAQQAASGNEDAHKCEKYDTWVTRLWCENKCQHMRGCHDYWPAGDGAPEPF